jgi:glycosyltransferase involved in cell wall biosynthesis
MMELALDAKRAFHNPTGLGNFSRWMIHLYLQYFPESELHLLSPRIHSSHWYGAFHQTRANMVDLGKGLSSLRNRTLPGKLLQSLNISHYHGMSNELPMHSLSERGIKSVVTIHDVIFKHYPHYYKAIDRKIYDLKMKRSLAFADAVHCISRSTANDLKKYYELEDNKIHVIPLGAGLIEPLIRAEAAREVKNEKPLLLCVSSFESRKNLVRLIEAFSLSAWANEGELILAGKKGNTYAALKAQIESKKLQNKVRCIENPSSTELAGLYRQADAFIYPSEFEGFGIPLLEAMYFELPMAVSATSSMPEVGGEAALYFQPTSVSEMSLSINKLMDKLNDSEWIRLIHKQFEKFQDQQIAEQWKKLYASI